MKKLSVLLLIAILLCSCTQGISSLSQATSQSRSMSQSNTAEPLTPEIGLAEENGNLIATTKTGIAQLYLQEKISEQCFTYLINFVSSADIYRNVLISDYKIIYSEEKYKSDYSFEMQYNVIKSDYPKIPKGSKTDIVQDIANVYIEDKDFVFAAKEIENEKAVKMLKAWFGSYTIKPVIYGKGYDYGQISNYLTGYYGKNSALALEEFKQLALDKFNIEKHEPNKLELFVKDDGTVEQGGMGGWSAYNFISCDKDAATGESIVKVQFYADASCRIPSKLIEYRINTEKEQFVDIKILDYGIGSPFGMIENLTGYSVKLNNVKELEEHFKSKSDYITLDKLVGAFINNDYAEMQKELLNTSDEAITKQYSQIQVNPDNYLIYADPNNEYSVMVSAEIMQGVGSNFNAGQKTFTIGVGVMTSYIMPANQMPEQLSIAQQWIKNYLSMLDVPNVMQMPTGDENNLKEFLILRLYNKYPGENGFTAEQLTQYAKKYLGIADYKVNENDYTENGKHVITPKGGCSTANEILSVDGTRENPEITVQFYADTSNIAKSHVVKYTLKLLDGEYALQDISVLEKSIIKPYRWCV